MSDASLEVQRAIWRALADGSPAPLDWPVFDGAAPEDEPYPFVVIGETTVADDGTKTEDGQDHTLVIHVWDRPADVGGPVGFTRTKTIMGEIRDLLHDKDDLDVTGHTVWMCRVEMQEAFLDDDGVTRHGVMRVRVSTQPE